MVLLFDEPETKKEEIWRLTGERYDLKKQINKAVGDMKRWPLKKRLAEVERRLEELKKPLSEGET